MASFPRWETCWSSYNLSSFLVWWAHYATAEEQEEAFNLYLVVHRSGPPPQFLVARGIVPQHTPLTLAFKDGRKAEMLTQECTEQGCARCRSGRGGYMFRWCDARWTPTVVKDLTLTPHQIAVEAYRPWPQGLRSVPPAAAVPVDQEPATRRPPPRRARAGEKCPLRPAAPWPLA